MSFAHLISKKQVIATICLTVLIALVPNQLSAQQQTGRAVPETRNPQTNAPQLFQQQTNVQPTSPQQLLNQPFKIEIPEGTPIKSSESSVAPAQSIGKQLFLLTLGVLAVVGSAVLLKRIQKPAANTLLDDPTNVDATAEQTVPQAHTSVKKHKRSKKKKSKGKPRKKH